MTENSPKQFDGVSVICKANIYFEGKVVSHTVLFGNGTKKTLGLIFPGSFTFKTGVPELMEIIAGSCKARLAGIREWTTYAAGSSFRVPGDSSFYIEVKNGVAEYVCSYE